VCLICSAPMEDAQPETVAAWVQGHWCIGRACTTCETGIRRGPLPSPDRERARRDGDDPQHRHHSSAVARLGQHSRGRQAPLQRLPTGREPPTHQLKSDFDEALWGHPAVAAD
jgi:hypothetical protein